LVHKVFDQWAFGILCLGSESQFSCKVCCSNIIQQK